MKFILFLLIFSSVAQSKITDPGGDDPKPSRPSAPQVSVPSLNFQDNTISKSLSFTENYFDKKIVQRPSIEVNQYLGDLTTSININLPKSFHSLTSLNLKYNSSQMLNRGYGIGMSLDLPRFLIDKNNGELKILNSEIPGELIPQTNLGEIARKRIDQLCNSISFKCDDAKKEYFLNQSGEDPSLYLKIIAGTFIKYAQIKTNGETWVFDKDGFPERVLTPKQKGLKIYFEDGILQKLEDLDSQWQAYLSYRENSKIVRSYNGALRNSILGLDNISISQGATQLTYEFSYSGEYLTLVSEKNSLKVLFQAEYDFPKNNSYEMVQESSPINFQNDSTIVYESGLNSIRWQKNSSDNVEFQVDLNGDFYTDKIVLNQKEIFDTAIAISKEYIPVISKDKKSYRPKRNSQEFADRLNNIGQKVQTFMAVNENGQILYKEDQSLSFPINEIKFLKFTVSEVIRHVEGEYNTFEVTDYVVDAKLTTVPKFVDLDGNGKKDILFCDYQSDLKPFEKTLGGTTFNGQKQNSIAAIYYDFYKNQTMNPLANKGQVQSIYMSYPDRKKLQLKARQNPEQKLTSLLNSSILKKVDGHIETKCNQLTIPIDYNNDGITDLLTGDQVTLFSETGAIKSLSLSVEELKKVINSPRPDLDFDKNPVDLIDLKNDGTLDFVSTFGTYFDHKDRSVVYLRDSVAYKVKRKTPVKLLTKEIVNFGGSAVIDYKYVAGASLVDSIFFNPALKKSEKNRKQPAFKKTYEYVGTRLHDQLNILMGHTSTQEKITRENVVMAIKVTEFDQDFQNDPIFYLTRSRKNGRILKQTIFDDTTKWTMITKNIFGEMNDLGQDRIFSYLKSKEQIKTGQGKVALVNQNEYLTPVGSIAFLGKINKSISASDQVITEKKYSLDADNFRFLQVAEQIKNQNGYSLASDSTYTYNSDAELVQAFSGGVNTNFTYDKSGRMINYVDQRGKKVDLSYYKNSPLVSRSKQNGSEFYYDYYDVTNYLKKSAKDKAAEVSYEWSTDEVLLSVERDGVGLYKLQLTPDLNLFKINIGDIERNYYLDGFGRVVQIERLTDDGNVTEKKIALDENDKVIKEWVAGSENATIVTSYDSLGREVSKELNGKLRLESAVFNLKTSTKYDQNGMQSTVEDLASNLKDYKSVIKNERGDIVNLKSLSENINFFLNTNGSILGIRELGAKYSYDLYDNVISTEARSPLFSWEKMKQKYDVIDNRLESDSGITLKDAEDQLVLLQNSSSASTYLQTHKYEKGLVKESNFLFKESNLKTEYLYDEEDLLSEIKIGDFVKKYKYDQFYRPIKETLNVKGLQVNIESNFSKGQIDSIAPFVTKIMYNEKSVISEIEYQNGVRASFEYDVFGKPTYLNWNVGADNYAQDYNTNLGQGEQSKLYTNVEYTGLKQKDKVYQYDEKIYLKKKARLTLHSKGVVFANSNLKQIENFNFTHENDLLVKIDYKGLRSFNNFVSPNKKWQGTCPVGFTALEECFIKINANEFISKGEFIKAIKIADKIAGVFYKEKFYPAITDHLGSVIALIDPDGEKLAFERVYNEWGEKEQVIGDKELEKNIPWAFAGLVQHPFFNGEILQSETRIYIPSLGLWSSADNLIKWNPDTLSSTSGNWDPLLYAGGNPANMIDPTGHYNLAASDGANFSMNFREQLKVDDFNKWNSAEGRAYKSEAQRNLGKAALVGAGVLMTAGFGGAIAAEGAAVARIAIPIITESAKALNTELIMNAAYSPRAFKFIEAASIGLIEGFAGARYGKGSSSAPGSYWQVINYGAQRGARLAGEYMKGLYEN